jgi:hypothetical protein
MTRPPASGAHEPSRNLVFSAVGDDILQAEGPGWRVRVTVIGRLRAVLAEIKAVGQGAQQLRGSAMVLTVDASMDEPAYRTDGVLEATGPSGTTVAVRSWESVVVCEALNIELAPYGSIVYDPSLGFYPAVR